jgi:hypothetical protein
MLKTAYYAILNAVWTLCYFMGNGFFYGAALGFILGTGFFPVAGTLVGLMLGSMIGVGSGFLIGIGVQLVHSLTFDHYTDLERYRRRLAIGVGVFVTLGMLVIAFAVASDLALNAERYAYPRIEWVLVALMMLIPYMWTALSSAYTASYYPDRIVDRLIRQRRLKIDHAMTQLGDHEVMKHADWLLKRVFTIWIFCASIVIAGTLFIAVLLRVPPGLEWVLAAAYAGIVAAGILILCCGVGNVALLVFLKQLIMPNMSPHRYRVTLTLVSFFYTLVSHWWTLIFAPVIALFIAYHVYHTLALPDYQPDKAKRKEAGLAVQG